MTTFEVFDAHREDIKKVFLIDEHGNSFQDFSILFASPLSGKKGWRFYDQIYTYFGETPESCVEAYLKHRKS